MPLRQMRARYPKIAAALEQFFEETAFHRRFAKTVARRAGLRQGPASLPPRTVIDAYIDPGEPPYARQYLTDLTHARRVRFYSRSSIPVYVFVSVDDSAELRPGDYEALVDGDSNPVAASLGSVGWQTLPEGRRSALRLTLSTSADTVEMNPDGPSGPFSCVLQAAS